MRERGIFSFSKENSSFFAQVRMSMRHKCRVMRPPFSFPRKKTGVARPKERRLDWQSAAKQTSLAPHDSKARLRVVTKRRGFMAKPCTPHPDYPQGVCHIRKAAKLPTAVQSAGCAALRATNCQCAGSRGKTPCLSLGVPKGGVLFGKRISPLTGSSAYALHSPSAQCAEKTIPPARQPPFTPLGVKQLKGVLCQKNS